MMSKPKKSEEEAVIRDGVCKYYDSTKESKHGLISFKSIFYIQN
jgi:hypothetical protein